MFNRKLPHELEYSNQRECVSFIESDGCLFISQGIRRLPIAHRRRKKQDMKYDIAQMGLILQ